jgi:curved DNA-binding protein CbpA
MTDEIDPYAVLQVSADADQAVIAAAYRALARRHHPDVAADPDAGARMARINAAWTILRDPARRRAYDLGRPNGANGAHAGGGSGTGARHADARHGAHHARSDGMSGSVPRGGAPQGGPVPNGAAHGWQGRHGPNGAHPTGWRKGPNGEGAAGPPPGPRSGSILAFGRHIGWSIGEIARYDPGYLEWLEQRPEGVRYREEIDRALRATGFRKPTGRASAAGGRGRSRG